jgi:superfamily II DNA or RNA helicase
MKFIVGNVFTHTVSTSPEKLAQLNKCLTYVIPSAGIIEKRLAQKYHKPDFKFDGVKSFYDHKFARFLTGFLGMVCENFILHGLTYEVMDNRSCPAESPQTRDYSLKGIQLRDYQERAISDILTHGRGVAKLPTGAGKTIISAALTKGLQLPTLFLTHRINLLHQSAERFVRHGVCKASQIGIIGHGQMEPKPVTFATVQTLYSMIKSQPSYTKDLLKEFKVLFIDEAHRSGARQFYCPACLCANAYYRIALTATPFMKGNDHDDMMLMGITGGIITNVSNGELIEKGVLAKPLFKYFTINEPDLKRVRAWRDIYERGIIYNELRNRIIAAQGKKLADSGHKILVIVNEKIHGQILEKYMRDSGVKVQYVDGGNTYEERVKALNMLRHNTLDAIIATNIFDEGIDVEDINTVILAAGNKSSPALFQRTGRAMRKKVENYCVVIDFIDNTHRHLLKHSMARFSLVKQENGFNIL